MLRLEGTVESHASTIYSPFKKIQEPELPLHTHASARKGLDTKLKEGWGGGRIETKKKKRITKWVGQKHIHTQTHTHVGNNQSKG